MDSMEDTFEKKMAERLATLIEEKVKAEIREVKFELNSKRKEGG